MAEEIDEKGFYREDFSTKSEWEVFNAQLGEILQDWSLSANDGPCYLMENELFKCKWSTKEADLETCYGRFTVMYYQAILERSDEDSSNDKQPQVFKDLLSLKNNFCPSASTYADDVHLLAKWYGLRRFVVLRQCSEIIVNDSMCQYLLSSATVVATDINSAVPIFISPLKPRCGYYFGVWVGQHVRINFDVVSLEKGPAAIKYLSGLLEMFKEKLNGNYGPATVSVRQTYVMGNITKYRSPMKIPFRLDSLAETSVDIEESPLGGTYFVALPYGYFSDSRTDVLVQCGWPNLAENYAIDSQNFTEFVPRKAHTWSFRIVTQVSSYMSSALHDFQSLENEIRAGTRSLLSISRSPTKEFSGPIKGNELEEMLNYIFPDQLSYSLFPYSTKSESIKANQLKIKSAAADSLVSRLCCLLATCNSHFGGKSGMMQLWKNFVRELERRLDACIQIPGINSGFPDMRTCLLHQKLQMLNTCMERRRIREFGVPFGSKEQTIKTLSLESDDEAELTDEDDEFFDCIDEDSSSGSGLKPQGRQSRFGDLKLIDCDEYLYVPVTQDPIPKTEDQLLGDAEDMLNFGLDSGSLRSLRSDMESFKAANPKGKLEDFIRWYSPRDWEEETDDEGNVKGHLSARMIAPDNTWRNEWLQAQPVAAWRQKRLFDDTTEGLKVLLYLDDRKVGDIYDLAILTLLHSAVLKLEDIAAYSGILNIFKEQIEDVFLDLSRIHCDNIPSIENESLSGIISKIEDLEKSLFQYRSLEKLFPKTCPPNHDEQQIMVESLRGDEVHLKGGPNNVFARRIVEKYRVTCASLESEEIFPEPSNKEYVIRAQNESSTDGPQFLRAIISGNSVRLCGAFSKNTTFV